MKIEFKTYNHDIDFFRIREFLQNTYVDDGDLINWTLERWNYVAFFIRDMFKFTIEQWSKTIGIWENEEGGIVSLVLNEAVGRGETFFQINPTYKNSIPFEEMFDFAEKNLQIEHEGYMILRPRIRESDSQLEEIAKDRGYVKREDAKETTSMIALDRDFHILIFQKVL